MNGVKKTALFGGNPRELLVELGWNWLKLKRGI
jgi:hypothetical protein